MTVLPGLTVTLRPATPGDALALATIRDTPEVRERWGGADDLTAEILDELVAPELHLLVIEEAPDCRRHPMAGVRRPRLPSRRHRPLRRSSAPRTRPGHRRRANARPPSHPRSSPPPAGRRPGRRQLGSHPLLHQGRVPTGRRHATVRARARRHLARRAVDGSARRRTDRLTHAHDTSMTFCAASGRRQCVIRCCRSVRCRLCVRLLDACAVVAPVIGTPAAPRTPRELRRAAVRRSSVTSR